MTILAIETSTSQGSVALLREGELLFHELCSADRGHSTALFEVLERALKVSPDVNMIAVGLGPGSYSGVRVAIAGAIGLQYGLRAELVGIPSICAIADGEYLAIQDARRASFAFAQVRDGACVDGPRLLSEPELSQIPGTLPVYVPSPIAPLAHAIVRVPEAPRLAALAGSEKSIVARDHLEPLYLRDPHITVAKPVAGLGR